MTRRFQRTIESFICEHCNTAVTGNGYTNHCPQCLWSKHVDINPGDRAEECLGLMEPVEVIVKTSEYLIVHRCQRCNQTRRVQSHKNDNFDRLVEIVEDRLKP